MINTQFENLRIPNAELMTIVMPYPVRVGEEVELAGITYKVKTVSWIVDINHANRTRQVDLHVRLI
jgi:hypothetical protein